MAGYDALVEAITLVYLDKRKFIHAVTTKLYPEIARVLDSTSVRVERNIRHAIWSTFEYSEEETLWDYFGIVLNEHNKKLTNTQFIATVAEHLKMEDETYEK